jgi:hypothetical protein
MKGSTLMKSQLKLAACALALCVVAASSVAAAGQKKWKVKEKHFEPVARQNVQEYAGSYVGIEDSYRIDLRVGDDGRLTGTSAEGGREVALADVRVEGATLTATRVYADGRRAQLVATFADRVLNGDREFGLMVENVKIELPGLMLTRVFYRRVVE